MSLIDKLQDWKLKREDFSIENLIKSYQKGTFKDYIKDKKGITIQDQPQLSVIDGNIVIASTRTNTETKYECRQFDVFNKENGSVLTINVEQQKEHFIAKGFRAVSRSHGATNPAASRVTLKLNGKQVGQDVFAGYFGFDEKGLQELSEHINNPKIKESFNKFVFDDVASKMTEKDKAKYEEITGNKPDKNKAMQLSPLMLNAQKSKEVHS